MRKILCLILLINIMIPQMGFCVDTESTNLFEIAITEVPPGSSTSGGGDGGGLSGGAVTAITLGSVFGGLGLLAGAGYYFAKHKSGLAAGAACGCQNPYSTVCISDNTMLEKLKLSPEKNNYLIKAFDYVQPKDCSCARFLLIQDSRIQNNTYNSVFFEMPNFSNKSTKNIRIIQVSQPYELNGKMPSLDSKILLNAQSKDVKEVATVIEKMDAANGILIKKGSYADFKNKTASVNTYYEPDNKNTAPKTYAIIVEFY